MIDSRQSSALSRKSPRQAILVDVGDLRSPGLPGGEQPTDPWAEELRRAVLLDLLGSLVAVNGVTISVLSAGSAHAEAIATAIPPGIDVIVPPADGIDREGRFVWAVKNHLQRAFSRVVAIAADVPALQTRIVATALGSLATSDVVVGPTTSTGLYLLGVCDERGLSIATAAGAATGFDGLSLAAITGAAKTQGAVVRSVERRCRLANDQRLDQLRDAVAATPSAAPRTAALLRTTTDASKSPTAFPAAAGIVDLDVARAADR